MLAPQDVAIFLNNELKPTHQVAELDRDTALPDAIRDMPDQVGGRFIDLDASLMHAIEVAWKRVMILNPSHVLYNFTFDPQTSAFAARKR
jgi:hypothetical protein